MNTLQEPTLLADDVAAQPKVSEVSGWKLLEYDVVDSTNLVARDLASWHAVRADTQTAGRGRFQRGWISDTGGLWLSAVVPTDAAGMARRTLPIAAGLAVCAALRTLRVKNLRMRWPNDLLVDDRKLCGMLVDQFAPQRAVVGIGINVTNRPEAFDPALENKTARLADLMPATPSLRVLARLVLQHLRRTMNVLTARDFRDLPPAVNELWGEPRRVELDLDTETRSGTFQGIDPEGRLILFDESRRTAAFDPWQVRHLREIQ